jgi:hypothetical protein
MQEFLNNLYKGTQSVGDDGYKKGRGLGAFIMQQVVDEDKLNQGAQRQLNQSTAQKEGYGLSELSGIDDTSSVYDVQGAAIKQTKTDQKTKEGETQTRALETIAAGQKPQLESIAASVKATESQTELLREQLLQQAKEANLNRAAEADSRADNLALQRMQMEREDIRYNERMEQLDRKDRRQGISSLAAGLAALGAAFAA